METCHPPQTQTPPHGPGVFCSSQATCYMLRTAFLAQSHHWLHLCRKGSRPSTEARTWSHSVLQQQSYLPQLGHAGLCAICGCRALDLDT